MSLTEKLDSYIKELQEVKALSFKLLNDFEAEFSKIQSLDFVNFHKQLTNILTENLGEMNKMMDRFNPNSFYLRFTQISNEVHQLIYTEGFQEKEKAREVYDLIGEAFDLLLANSSKISQISLK
jgi:hypothetical protein